MDRKLALLSISTCTVLLVLILSLSAAYAQEGTAVEECIKKYQGEGLSYEDAKSKCTAAKPTATPEPAEAPEPEETQTAENVVLECIAKYQKEKGLSYDEAKKLCTQVTGTPSTTPEPAPEKPAPTVTVDECIKKYMEAYKLSYEDAKAKCYPAETPAPTKTPASSEEAILECIAKYQKEHNLSYEDAKKKCSEPVKLAPPVAVVVDSCALQEKKLFALTEKLKEAKEGDVEELKRDIESVKKALGECAVKTSTTTTGVVKRVIKPECAAIEEEIILLKKKLAAEKEMPEWNEKMNALQERYSKCLGPTPQVKNPCDEAAMLKDSLGQLEKKIAYIKELIAKGEMKESDLEPYYTESKYLRERLMKMSSACQQGSVVEESPCARLAKLEVIYKEINDKIAGVVDEKTKAEVEGKLASVVEEIILLKEKCKAESLGAEKVESLDDVGRAYNAKLKIVVEGAGEEELLAELRRIEEEKKTLLEEFAQRMQELEVRKTTIIKKLKVGGGEVYLDDIKTRATKVKVEVEDKDIGIESKEEGVVITDGNATAAGDVDLEYEGGELISARSKKKIAVMPGMVGELVKEELKELEIADEEGPKYLAKTEKKGRFLGIIPITIAKQYEISAESGEIIKEKKPWWSSLVY